jgi:hypothetical protein
MDLCSIFTVCTPRPEILSGDLSADIFAAKLRPVVEKRAPHIYQDPAVFFANTFVTNGLQELLGEVFGRLMGQRVGSPVIRLETSFGGGKTHDEIALWHLAKQGRSPLVEDKRFAEILPLLPEQPIQVAAVDGRDLSPEEGIYHAETGVTTKTIWGEIAYQVKGIEGYELLRGSDERGISPGTAVLERLIQDRPTLIILDEIARYLSAAKAKRVEESNLAKKVIAFLFSLMDCAAACNNLVFVYSLASSTDTFAEETEELQRELRSASARQERILRPSNDVEIYNIVKQRLFASISLEAAERAADTYFETYRASRTDLPDRCKELQYRTAIADSYPFHPELFNLLTKKIASIPEFQRTRGALRLFAQVIQDLWQDSQASIPLIHSHHLPVGVDTDVTGDLTSRLNRPQMDLPIRADIYNESGTPAFAQLHDREWSDRAKPPFSTWVARTIFLHSLTQGITAGIRRSELNLSLLMPRLEIGFVDQALEKLLTVAWHLDFDPITTIYQFKEEPSINKIIAQEKSQVQTGVAKAELRQRRDSYFARKFFDCVTDPEGPHEVDDRPDTIALCLIDFNEVTLEASNDPVPGFVQQIFENTGAVNQFRVFKNRLLFLLANRQELDKAINLTKEYIAVKTLRQSGQRLQDLSESQQKELKTREGALDLGVRIALTNTYRHLFYPSQDALKAPKGLIHSPLPTQDSSTVKGKNNQQEVILKALKDCGKIRPDEAKPYAPAYVLQKVWPEGIDQWSTKSLREAFAKNINLYLLLEGELSKLRDTIREGLTTGQWDMQQGQQVFIHQPPQSLTLPPLEFSDRQVLFRRGILKAPEPRVIEFNIQPMPGGETEKQVRLRWKAKGAIAVSLYQNGALIQDNYLPSDSTEVVITETTLFRVVADYGEAGTEETSEQIDWDKLRAKDGTGNYPPGSDTTRPPEAIKTGTPSRAFNELADELEKYQPTSISALEIAIDGIQDYRKLSTAIALLNRHKPQIDQSVTLQANGQFTQLKYQGDLRGFQAFAGPLNQLLNTPTLEGSAHLKLCIEFPEPIPVTGGTLEEIQGILSKNPVSRLQLLVRLKYEKE